MSARKISPLEIKRFPKPLLSPQQADGVLRSASRRKSLMSNWAQQAAGHYTQFEIKSHIVGNVRDFDRQLIGHRGIFLGSEDSLFDADRIDEFLGGRVSSETVDIEAMKGNANTLKALEYMLSFQQGAFFPGTLLRDFGGYAVQTMPIIINGKIVDELIKLTGIPYIDDETALARSRGYQTRSGTVKECHIQQLRKDIQREVDIRRKSSVRSYAIGKERVLPVICNELSILPSHYEGPPVSVVLHSASDYISTYEERLERYTSFLGKMRSKNKIRTPLIFAYAEHSSNPEIPSAQGTFIYDGKILREKR